MAVLRPHRCVLPPHILHPGQVDIELWKREVTVLNVFSDVYALEDSPSTGLDLGNECPCAHQWFAFCQWRNFCMDTYP